MTSYIDERVGMIHGSDIIADGTDDERFSDAERNGININCDVRRIGHIGDQVVHLTNAAIERQLNFVRGCISNIG